MNPIQYFQSTQDYFWQWEDNGQVVSIPHGATIAYREYLQEVLELLEPQGIPPFGSLLLVIIATNPKGLEGIKMTTGLLHNGRKEFSSDSLLIEANNLLISLSNLPAEYKTGKKRRLLIQTIFQGCHNRIGKTKAPKFIEAFKNNKIVESYKRAPYQKNVSRWDLRPLSLINEVLPNTEAILKKIANVPVIDDEELIFENETNAEQAAKDFIEELKEHDHTFHVGALVKQIWSGLQIPFHNNVPSEQPLGGIADVTNKGDFDKLLLSEFANEDIVLMSRLANNEALYFHREIPPTDNNLQRIILIDASLKNWGTIKTLSFASLLAIAKHPKNKMECNAFVVGEDYHSIAFDNVHDVINGQQILEPSLDASVGLEKFFKENNLNKREVFLLTAQETLRHGNMFKLMNDYGTAIDYWIHPTTDGEISLYKKQNNSKKFVQKIKLPLEELWKRKRENKTPVLLKDFDYPLLFPNPINPRQFLYDGHASFYKITREKTLLRWQGGSLKDSSKIGWEIKPNKILGGIEHFAIGRNLEGEEILLMYNHQEKLITLLNLENNTSIEKDFSIKSSLTYPNCFFYVNQFYFLRTDRFWSINLDGDVKMVEGRDDELIRVYTELQKTLKGASRQLEVPCQVLKNIKQVFINASGHLVFNVHQLHCNHGVLKLNAVRPGKRNYHADKINDGQFSFSDGSTIVINRAGMIVLQSSNSAIPRIYLTSVLERALAAATDEHFAGSEYFLKKNQFDVNFKSSVSNKIVAIKVIKKVLGISLKDVREMVENAPGSLVKNVSKTLALELKDELKKVNVAVHLRPLSVELRTMGAGVFFHNYIKKFTEHIYNHAT